MAHAPALSQTLATQSNSRQEEEDAHSIYPSFTNLLSTIPGVHVDTAAGELFRHSDGWYAPPAVVVGAVVAQQHFKARPTDVLLVSLPKSGTTWLKALLFATVHRRRLPVDVDSISSSGHPFTTLSPHECVPFIESQLYANGRIPDSEHPLPSLRVLSTHIPFRSLPESVVGSGCRIVYLCRDPKDNFVSSWHFLGKVTGRQNPVEVALDQFCEGLSLFGPCWDHMLGYWKAHSERPDKVLFLKYEELAADPVDQLRRLAEFVGCPFGSEEEEGRMAEAIVRLCAIENLTSLEVNKTGSTELAKRPVQNSSFFRRGVVGDWENYLTPEMARRLDEITETKFKGSGLALY